MNPQTLTPKRPNKRLILREERNFVEAVEGTVGLASTLLMKGEGL